MPELSVVVPAFRERDNIPALLRALDQALKGLDWETIIVVDDAFDGSEDLVRERAQQDRRVRCIRSEEHTSELQSHSDLVCRLLLEKKNTVSPTTRSSPAASGP